MIQKWGQCFSTFDAAYGNHRHVTSTVSDVVEKLVMNEGRISRGGALHLKRERNSRFVPPFPHSPRCLIPFHRNHFSLHCLDFQAEDRLTPRWHVGQPCGTLFFCSTTFTPTSIFQITSWSNVAAGAPAGTSKQQKEIARQDPQRLTWKLHSMTYFHPTGCPTCKGDWGE